MPKIELIPNQGQKDIANTGGCVDLFNEVTPDRVRTAVSIANISAPGGANLFISIGTDASTTTSGIVIGPGFAFQQEDTAGRAKPSNYRYSVIASADSARIAFYETVEDLQ